MAAAKVWIDQIRWVVHVTVHCLSVWMSLN